TWYNGPSDLTWMSTWENTVVPQTYASGRAMHLITWSPGPETGCLPTPTQDGGRQYPISAQVLDDMRRLAEIFGGNVGDPPLYVTLFTEFQTFPCIDNQWAGAEGYYLLLKTKMLQIRDIFHAYAPNSLVSIGWGGWQARWDAPGVGGGRSLFPHFDDVSSQMDFQSFQAMHYSSVPTEPPNQADVRAMTATLGAYGPVMVAHHKPDGFHPDAFDRDIQAIMTDSSLSDLAADGLFAWSFMDQAEINYSPTNFSHVRDAVLRYSGPACEGPSCNVDSDNDGCTDGQELGPNRALGGQRNPAYFWDFYDTPNASGTRDHLIATDDLARVVGRFGASRVPAPGKAQALQEALTPPPPLPAYHPGFDRSAVAGVLSGPPDGSITVNDILLLVAQFGHSCVK
ncbi:MAG: flexitail domain-containing putative surface protein, partial [Dehalococcoidia bacterium]